jgi:Icc protein
MRSVRTVRLLQLSDPHLFADETRELYGVNTAATFHATLTRALKERSDPLDAILVSGDVAEDGQASTYRRFRSIMADLGVPVLCLPGNHEDRLALNSYLDEPPLRYCGSHDLADWRVVMLDSHLPGSDAGRLEAGELRRLDRELASAKQMHVLVCLHHQALPVGSPWLDACGLQNASALREVLQQYDNVRAVLSGHVHQASDAVDDGIRFITTPSTCAQFTPNTSTCLMDLRPPGYRWLHLTPAGEIETQVVWLDELQRADRPPDSRRVGAGAPT